MERISQPTCKGQLDRKNHTCIYFIVEPNTCLNSKPPPITKRTLKLKYYAYKTHEKTIPTLLRSLTRFSLTDIRWRRPNPPK